MLGRRPAAGQLGWNRAVDAIRADKTGDSAMIDDRTPPDDADVRISAKHVRELLHQIVEIRAALDRVETRLRIALRDSGA